MECGNLSNGNLSILSVCLLDAGLNTYLPIQIHQLVTKGDFTVRSLMDSRYQDIKPIGFYQCLIPGEFRLSGNKISSLSVGQNQSKGLKLAPKLVEAMHHCRVSIYYTNPIPTLYSLEPAVPLNRPQITRIEDCLCCNRNKLT